MFDNRHKEPSTSSENVNRVTAMAGEEVTAVEIEGSVMPFRVAADDIPTVVIANRNEIDHAGIELLLHAGGYRVVARCSHEHDLLRFVETFNPNVILVADNIADRRSAETVRRLRAGNSSAAIILLLEERQAIAATDLLDLKVDGILLSVSCAKSIIGCCENVLHGRKWVDPDLLRHLAMEEQRSQLASSLTSREAEVAHLVSQGLRNKEIARELHLSEGTVKMYLHHIFEKLRLNGRAQLALSMVGARATTKPPDCTCSNRKGRLFLLPFFLHQSSFFDTIVLFFQI